MTDSEFPAPQSGFVVTHFLVVSDQDQSRDFYRPVFGATVVLERDPVILKIANSWLILNVGGGLREVAGWTGVCDGEALCPFGYQRRGKTRTSFQPFARPSGGWARRMRRRSPRSCRCAWIIRCGRCGLPRSGAAGWQYGLRAHARLVRRCR